MKAVIASLALGVALAAGALPAGAVPANAAVKADSSPADQIEARVHRDATLKGHHIKATVDGGVATLTGTVATESQKAKAAQLAHVKGITRVDNQIVVDRSAAAKNRETIGTKAGKGIDKSKNAAEKAGESTKDAVATAGQKTKESVSKAGAEITDAWIISRVHSRFVGDDLLKGSDINVDSDNHMVTLKGTVATQAGRARALQIARDTEGVKRVVDHLVVGPKK
jgi:hyperosmotically inducible protein